MPPSEPRLDSWKEIAAFLGRDVTTVRRWEKREGLPVHRHHHLRLGSVYAYVQELEAWRAAREQAAGAETASGPWRRASLAWAALGVALLGGLAGFVALRGAPRGTASGRAKVMLVVLPFANLDGAADQEYLSDGLSEELIARLAALEPGRLGVIARTSAMYYKKTPKRADEIGRELGVEYLLEGGVRRSGRRVRITARLVQISDQTPLFSRDFEAELGDIIALQKDVARAVTEEIRLQLSPAARMRLASGRAVAPEAYEAHLRGRAAWARRTADSLRTAIAEFQRAITLDPTYGPAFAGLADTYSLLSYYASVPSRESFPSAKAAALRAIELDPGGAEAHTSLAYVLHHYDWEWEQAEAAYRRALELNPNYATAHHWYGEFLVTRGRLAEARAELALAQRLDPLSPRINLDVTLPDHIEGRFEKVVEAARRVLDLHPDFTAAHDTLREVYEAQGRYEEAAAELGHLPEAGRLGPETGRDARSYWRTLLDLAQRGVPPFASSMHQARVYEVLGDRRRALDLLEKAYEERDDELTWLAVDSWADDMRAEPRFAALSRKLKMDVVPRPVTTAAR